MGGGLNVKNNAGNQDFTNNADGWDLTGGTTRRKLTLTGAGVTLTGSGTNTFTFPASTCTLAGLSIAQTWSAKQSFNDGCLAIPSGTAPTVDAAGEIAVDTTNDQLLVYGSALFVAGIKKRSFSFKLPTPTASETEAMCQVPYAITLTNVRGTVRGGTSVTFNIEERASNALNSAGSDTLVDDITATQTGVSDASFINAGIAANAFLVLTTSGLSGTVNELIVEVDYTIDRT
jgi:hypothetical protein